MKLNSDYLLFLSRKLLGKMGLFNVKLMQFLGVIEMLIKYKPRASW